MDGGENLLGAIYEEDDLVDIEDVEMLDVEEGEVLECNSSKQTHLGPRNCGDVNVENRDHKVDAIQACGGQMTADGRRCRMGAGILWGIIKARVPGAYKKIMKKTKEFEKQFRQQSNRQAAEQTKDSSVRIDSAATIGNSSNIPNLPQVVTSKST